eukprot:2695569-Pleurochrysis_carterae.AAC.3
MRGRSKGSCEPVQPRAKGSSHAVLLTCALHHRKSCGRHRMHACVCVCVCVCVFPRASQLESLNWLLNLHARDLNGILADEMGLGKTLQARAAAVDAAHSRRRLTIPQSFRAAPAAVPD